MTDLRSDSLAVLLIYKVAAKKEKFSFLQSVSTAASIIFVPRSSHLKGRRLGDLQTSFTQPFYRYFVHARWFFSFYTASAPVFIPTLSPLRREVADILGTSIDSGLSDTEATQRQQQYGPNSVSFLDPYDLIS
jgi:hypothetical protein